MQGVTLSNSVALNSSLTSPRSSMRAWLVCLSAGLFFFYEFFQLNIFDVINQPLRYDFHLNAAQLSWMSSTYLWADILFLLPAGMILDRFSTRTVILTAMSICVLGTFGFAMTHSFILACFYHFLSGIGNAFCFLSCVVLVSHWFPPRRQALVIGSLVTMAFLGGMMAHTPFARLTDLYGWRQSLLIDGAIGAVLFIWIALIVQDSPTKINRSETHRAGFSSFLAAIKNRQTWFAGLYTSFLNLPIMVLCALWGATYLEIVHYLPELTASNVISMIFVGSIIGCPLFGWLSDTQGQRKPIMFLGAIATFLSVVPLFMNLSLTSLELSLIFFALGFFSSSQVISYPLIAESNPPELIGSSTGIASVLIMGGAGVGQVLFGYLMQFHADNALNYSTADFQFAMWIFPIAALLALLVLFLSQETYCKHLK